MLLTNNHVDLERERHRQDGRRHRMDLALEGIKVPSRGWPAAILVWWVGEIPAKLGGVDWSGRTVVHSLTSQADPLN